MTDTLIQPLLSQEKALAAMKLLQDYPKLHTWSLPKDCRHLKKYVHRAAGRNLEYLANEILDANKNGGEVFYSADDVNKRNNQAKVDTITIAKNGTKREFTTGCHSMAMKDENAQSFTLDHIKNLLSSTIPTEINWDHFSAFCADREGAQMAAMKEKLGDDKFYGCHAHLCLKSEKLVAETLQAEELKASTSGLSLYPVNSYTKSNTNKTTTVMYAFRKLMSTQFSNLTYNVSGDITQDIKLISAGGDRFGATSVNSALILKQRNKIVEYLGTITATGIVEVVLSYCKSSWFWVCLAIYASTGYEFTIFLMKKLNLKIDNRILVDFYGDDRFEYDSKAKACSYNEITEWMRSFKGDTYEFKRMVDIVL